MKIFEIFKRRNTEKENEFSSNIELSEEDIQRHHKEARNDLALLRRKKLRDINKQ